MATENVNDEENVEAKEKNQAGALGFLSVHDFIQNVLKNIVEVTQNSNNLSTTSDNYSYLLSFPVFSEYRSEEGNRILDNVGELLRHQGVQCGWAYGKNVDMDERFERLIDANDIIFESVGSLLDDAVGLKKNNKPIISVGSVFKQSPIVSSWNHNKNYRTTTKSSSFKLLMAKNILRPQLNWIDKIDNSNTGFVPMLREKHNSVKSIDDDQEEMNISRNPYAYELSVLEPCEWQLKCEDPRMYLPLESTNLTFVDTKKQLDDMLLKLNEVCEFAVDLENHSYRSFQGFLCLMQISTRTEDFIIDAIKLRDELHILNKVFTNPKILKVMHGADSDISWLQRDFSVYVVNMFDTGQAARTLSEERFSLAHLLNKYCGVNAQKQYQLADWRIRPLPKEMLDYAQEDTHYLLYVYDILRNRLINNGNEMNNLLRSVYSKSAAICGVCYEKPLFTCEAYLKTYEKYRGQFNPHQLECFRLVFEWRDTIAREEDESCGYTLPNHMLFQIAENLPKEPQGVIACCNPVPPLVKQHTVDIHYLVMEARTFDHTTVCQSIVSEQIPDKENSINMNSVVKDNSSKTGFELFAVLGPKIEKLQPCVTIFECGNLISEERRKKVSDILSLLQSPFQIYLPNSSQLSLKPEEINKTWKQACQGKREESNCPAVTEKKRKRKTAGKSEMLSKKPKGSKDREKHLVNYEETVKLETDIVQFDYSKADLKTFSVKENPKSHVLKSAATKEVNLGPVIKTMVHAKSGVRSMTFK